MRSGGPHLPRTRAPGTLPTDANDGPKTEDGEDFVGVTNLQQLGTQLARIHGVSSRGTYLGTPRVATCST